MSEASLHSEGVKLAKWEMGRNYSEAEANASEAKRSTAEEELVAAQLKEAAEAKRCMRACVYYMYTVLVGSLLLST